MFKSNIPNNVKKKSVWKERTKKSVCKINYIYSECESKYKLFKNA